METKKVAKEYLQKDILRTIFQMRKRQEDDKQIKKIIVLDYDLTEYHWKTNIKKLQEEGFLETDSDAKIPALTESGTEYARQLQRAAEGWNQFLQMSGVNEKTADRDGRLMACEVSDPDKIENLWKFINDGGRSSIPKSVDCHTLWKKLKPGKYQMWYSFYTTEIGKERKAAIEDMRFERDGWLHIEPWEIWLELTEHPENEDDRTIWYQNMYGIWKNCVSFSWRARHSIPSSFPLSLSSRCPFSGSHKNPFFTRLRTRPAASYPVIFTSLAYSFDVICLPCLHIR